MPDSNRLYKWLLIIAMVVISLALLYPPGRKLKGGIDLVGGTSLLYDIDTSGLRADEQRELSSRVMRILKERVDPKGQMNLEWRPVGNARLEVRMPRPPAEALARREAYNKTLEQITGLSLKRREVEDALNSPADQRDPNMTKLQRGVKERDPLLKTVTEAYANYTTAQQGSDATIKESASAAYEDALSKLLATSLPPNRLSDVLALSAGDKRTDEMSKLGNEFPSYNAGEEGSPTGKLLAKAAKAYDEWAENKADLEDPSDLKRRLRGAGVLEFRILAEREPSSPEYTADPAKPQTRQSIQKYVDQLTKYGPKPKAGDLYRWLPVQDNLKFTHSKDPKEFEAKKEYDSILHEYAGRWYVLTHNSAEYGMLQSTGKGKNWALKQAYPDRNALTGENVVSFALDARGGRQFGELTGSNIKRQLCIFLDGAAVSHANINERITDRCQISGKFTPEDTQYLVGTLEAGSLPARLKDTPLAEQTVGPSLGETNRTNGLRACVVGGALVALFVLFYYGIAGGGIANIALAVNLLFTLALMAMMQATFTLPGIAGLILTVGMAIDANVLIFERIREELARGVVFKKALNLGYDKAFSAIFDSNLTTLLTCIILGFVGSEEVKGFAIALGLGLATSMFTALFCTRLAYNSLVSIGWLNGFSMRKLIGIPNIDWVGLRHYFLPISGVVVALSVTLFVYTSVVHTEKLYDIEFLGGTSVQLDLKAGANLTDDQVRDAISSDAASAGTTAATWLSRASTELASATVTAGSNPSQFIVSSKTLLGDQLAALLRRVVEPKVERDGITAEGNTVTLDGKPGELTDEVLKAGLIQAAGDAKTAVDRMRNARVQSVGGVDAASVSYEVVTVETNRPLVQAAILAALGDKLSVQRPIRFTPAVDNDLLKEPFFVIESEDQYLKDVIGGDSISEIRQYRGGVAVKIDLDANELALPVAELERRIREVGLQPEFEQFRAREWAVLPLGAGVKSADGVQGFKQFAVCSVDETLSYEDDNNLWMEAVARPELELVKAALSSEKSFSKVVQFAPQIAGQTQNRALFALVLSMVVIAVYVWMRFGNRDFGFAVLIALVHDVAITLGLVALSHYVFGFSLAKLLLFDDFKVDLSMVAAVLTVIGFSLNDTIVVFDRIRENKGKTGTLSANLINSSLNQTLSRTVLTSLTVFVVVFVLYAFGGKGVHGFSVALLIGVITGTYSTVGIAVPMVYAPKTLARLVLVMAALGLIGLIFGVVGTTAMGLILSVVVAGGCVWKLMQGGKGLGALQPA